VSNILLVNISWNPSGWRNTYINPKAGHSYAREFPGHESLNFKFNKKGIDTNKLVYGYAQRQNTPMSFENGGLIIFNSLNTETRTGQIVGVYGKAEVIDETTRDFKGFRRNAYSVNIRAEKDFSILFPIPLESVNYKKNTREMLVGRPGFAYKTIEFAENILNDEITQLSNTGILEKDYEKLVAVYEYYIGKKFKLPFINKDEKEQNELAVFYKKTKSKADILSDLKNLKGTEPEEIVINRKTYKRDNKTIALIKILRDFKCQICGTTIKKKDGSKYVEAAHIKPKYQKGREMLDNIILLCPNHHKEFDFGHREIKLHNANQIKFVLNGKQHIIKLSA
jgi:HNH endonuclease